jgi:hypothetical protein
MWLGSKCTDAPAVPPFAIPRYLRLICAKTKITLIPTNYEIGTTQY